MKRALQIIEKASEIEKDMGEQELSLNWGLIKMAEWADQNPVEPIGDLIYQRSIAYDEALKAKEALKEMVGTRAYNIQLLKDNENLHDKLLEAKEEITQLKRKK